MDGCLLVEDVAESTGFHLVFVAWVLIGRLVLAPFPAAGKVGCGVQLVAGKVGLGWLLQTTLDASSLLEQFLPSFLILFLPNFDTSFLFPSSFGIKNGLHQSS